MVKYEVRDNYSQLDEFNTYEDAREFAERYVDMASKNLLDDYGACGVTEVTIYKVTYKNVNKVLTSPKLYTLEEEKILCRFYVFNEEDKKYVNFK